MKLSKFFAVVFAALGILLMTATIVLCFLDKDSLPLPTELPPEAAAVSEEMMEALAAGEYQAAQALMYGQPELSMYAAPEEELSSLVWALLPGSLEYRFSGRCYLKGGTVCRDVEITYLDAHATADAIPQAAQTFLRKMRADTEDLATLYDEDGSLYPQVSHAILREALDEALKAVPPVQVTCTLQMVQKDSRWWVIPDALFFTAISGGIA